jgi:hypothetical protein
MRKLQSPKVKGVKNSKKEIIEHYKSAVIILQRAQRVLDIQVQDALNMNREPQRMGDIELCIQTLNK